MEEMHLFIATATSPTSYQAFMVLCSGGFHQHHSQYSQAAKYFKTLKNPARNPSSFLSDSQAIQKS